MFRFLIRTALLAPVDSRFTIHVANEAVRNFRAPYGDPVYFTGMYQVAGDVAGGGALLSTATAVVTSNTDELKEVSVFEFSDCATQSQQLRSSVPLLIGSAGAWSGGEVDEENDNIVLFSKFEVPTSAIVNGQPLQFQLTDPLIGDRIVFEKAPVAVVQVQYQQADFAADGTLATRYGVVVQDVTRAQVDVRISFHGTRPTVDKITVGVMAFVELTMDWSPDVKSQGFVASPEVAGDFPALADATEFPNNCGGPMLFASRTTAGANDFRTFYTCDEVCTVPQVSSRDCTSVARPLNREFRDSLNLMAFWTRICESATQSALFSEEQPVEVPEGGNNSALFWGVIFGVGLGILGIAAAYVYVRFRKDPTRIHSPDIAEEEAEAEPAGSSSIAPPSGIPRRRSSQDYLYSPALQPTYQAQVRPSRVYPGTSQPAAHFDTSQKSYPAPGPPRPAQRSRGARRGPRRPDLAYPDFN
ncbi:MAG: uncharacterized protein KVP18_004784 [Porospora cf. gigantea A]|uniref:uncharacterized protein n=1 Tax=Porospora cf. gigantea A TaxID=2853593 RepID=UPI0035596E4F|nr:MAG: hypothetical protein KVP18_004784 [Porospora cf. gigantea A]